MIQTDNFVLHGRKFIRTYSDEGRYVVRNGASYAEACDPAELGRTYTEGELMEETDLGAEDTLNILLGNT